MTDKQLVSTSSLAKLIGISSKELFSKFVQDGLIEKNGDQWNLTAIGQKIGGQYLGIL